VKSGFGWKGNELPHHSAVLPFASDKRGDT